MSQLSLLSSVHFEMNIVNCKSIIYYIICFTVVGGDVDDVILKSVIAVFAVVGGVRMGGADVQNVCKVLLSNIEIKVVSI